MPWPVELDCPKPLLSCRDLTVTLGGQVVLDRVSLSVPAGAFLPLVGPNGAGKTTLLRALLGLAPIRSGRVETPFAGRPPGYVPQQGVIDPLFPVPAREIVAMGFYPRLGWRRRPGRAMRERAEARLAELGLAGMARKTFAQLSGGMRQKVLIARALVGEPRVLMLDEPTAGLDPASQREILAILGRLNQREGVTVIMAHHGEELLLGLVEEVCLVRERRVQMRRLSHAD